MRLQHLKQIASALSADDPARVAAKAVIVAEVERLHWRNWNGKAKKARINIDRIRAVTYHFQGEPGSRKSIAPSRKLWTALQALDGYLTGQSNWLVNYAERHRAGLRVGTAITEGTANFLVNRRMNKSRQMRWSRRGADLLPQVRCAIDNGTFGSAYGQKFQPANDSSPPIALAAWPPILRQSLDNLSTHSQGALYEKFPAPRHIASFSVWSFITRLNTRTCLTWWKLRSACRAVNASIAASANATP